MDVASVLHQRPWKRIPVPSLISSVTTTHLAPHVVDGVECPLDDRSRGDAVAYEAEYAHLRRLCEHFIVSPPPHGATFFTTVLGPLKLRWERHTEVTTYTFTRCLETDHETGAVIDRDAVRDPFNPSNVAVALVPPRWLAEFPGAVVAATHVAVLDQERGADEPGGAISAPSASSAPSAPSEPSELSEPSASESAALLASVAPHFNRSEVITGASVDRGRFRAYSDWRCHGDGFNRIVLHHAPDDRRAFKRSAAGKAAQRLLELDKYRMLALFGLPFANNLGKRVDELDRELMGVMESIGGGANGEDLCDAPAEARREVLARLTRLAATGLKLSSVARDRFAASEAYGAIVDDRVKFLQMDAIPGVPSMASFISAASHPARRRCDATRARLEKVATSAQLTAEIMRTSLTVEQQARGNENLTQLKRTAHTQLVMQHNVEGLSVVAITYYSTGVLGYLAKAAVGAGMALPMGLAPEVALGAVVPLVWIGTAAAIARMKRAAHAEEAPR
jgi:uncharacterized membrane-anchored protein